MGTAIKQASLTLRAERQSARMSKISNDVLTQSGTGCFIALPTRQQWASKGYNVEMQFIWFCNATQQNKIHQESTDSNCINDNGSSSVSKKQENKVV